MEDDIPKSIRIFNILLVPVALTSSIAHGLVVYIYSNEKYGKVSQVSILSACVSIIDIINIMLQTLLLPIFTIRHSWYKLIILYIIDSVEYSTVYSTCCVACHIYCGLSIPFKYHVFVSAGNKYVYFQFGFIIAISLLLPPVFNSYENISDQHNTTITCQLIPSHQFEMTERNEFSKYEKLFMQCVPLSVGFFLALRATRLIWVNENSRKEMISIRKQAFNRLRKINQNKGLLIIAELLTITVAIVPRTLYKFMQQ